MTDGGLGIEADTLLRVFQPFVQDAPAARFRCAGAGLGLTVARAVIEAHGGRIEARSDGAGKGSRFVVSLPFAS